MFSGLPIRSRGELWVEEVLVRKKNTKFFTATQILTCAQLAIRKLSACPTVVFVTFFWLPEWGCCHCCFGGAASRTSDGWGSFLDWAAFVACYQLPTIGWRLSAACRVFLLFKLRNALSTICPLIYWLLWRCKLLATWATWQQWGHNSRG